MIFVTNSQGRATFVSPEWTEHTGQSLEDAIGFGWAKVVHPEDREITSKLVADAIQAQSPFTVRYRLMARDGGCMWVTAGAIPSFGPPDQTFLGFLGSITRIAEAETTELRAYGSLGQFDPPPRLHVPPPGSALELAADLLLMAHTLITSAGVASMRPPIEEALHAVGVELARVEQNGNDPTQFH